MILSAEILFYLLTGFPVLGILILALIPNAEKASKAGFFFILLSSVAGVILISTTWSNPPVHFSSVWFSLGNINIDFILTIDSIAVMMLSLVSFIGMLVYLFSLTYLKDHAGLKRYFIILIIFMLSMFGLVISGNLFQLFFFWELVGFCSFGLIGFYFDSDVAARAAKKAFLVNRIADVFLIIGLGLVYQQFGTLSLTEISQSGHMSFWAALLLFLGACGKSAQYPFAIWLPDAMAGPTPVSAFIHAATMVTAGILLMVRVYFMLPVDIMVIIVFTGTITAVLAAIAAMVQHDIKKVLAYSTISQLGYMMIGLGTGAWDASIFHLFTHAFFKAGLFINAGAVILWLKKFKDENAIKLDPQDLRNMGGLGKHLPVVFISFTLCTLALIGVPFFTGFLSKDAILSGAYAWAESKGTFFFIVPDIAFITIILTAIYMFRLLSLIFLGDFKFAAYLKSASSFKSTSITFTSLILGILSLGFFVSINPLDISQNWIMPGIRNAIAFSPISLSSALPAENHLLVSSLSVLMIILGAVYAWWKYRPSGFYHKGYTNQFQYIKPYQKTVHSHYYLDKAYQYVLVNPLIRTSGAIEKLDRKVIDRSVNIFGVTNVIFAHIIKWTDKHIIDGIINFSAFFAGFMGRRFKSLASGKVQGQVVTAFMVLLIILYLILF